MRKAILLSLVCLILLVAPTAARYLKFYAIGGEKPLPPPTYVPEQIAPVPTPASNTFVDSPEPGEGLVLLDEAHDNHFSLDDISYLDGRLAARGFELLHYTGGDLAHQLRPVNAFITIAPLSEFSTEEIQAITRFVNRGGHVLMVGDPTRYEFIVDEEDPFAFILELDTNKIPLNSLANQFGLIFNGDYLYNTIESEGNFRNIILKSSGFSENALVDGLEKLALYGTHSIQTGPEAEAIITADDNTWSSATDRPGGLVLAAMDKNRRVLALGDVNFLANPYYTVFDNSHFIANIADFLTTPDERTLQLVDFPYFYQRPVDLIYTDSPDLGAGAFANIIDLQNTFSQANIPLALAQAPQPAHDVLYLGLYNQSEDVVDILASAGISLTIEPAIEPDVEEPEADGEKEESAGRNDYNAEEDELIEAESEEEELDAVRLIHSELGDVEMSGTALIVLDESNGRRTVVVLAASREGLENTVSRLLEFIPIDAETALSHCFLQDSIALCSTLIEDEEVEAELVTSHLDIDDWNGVDEDEPGDDDIGEPGPDLEGVDMGNISLGETVSDVSMEEGEAHIWTFNEGPAVIDILLETSEDLDSILELYDPLNNFIASADNTLVGEPESLTGIEIPDDGDYSIRVRGFFGEGGKYTLSVTEGVASEEERETAVIESIFLFIDDDGEPIQEGISSLDTFVSLLEPNYAVTVWISSLDGPLEQDLLEEFDLIIWDSGDYLNTDGFLDEDAAILFSSLDDGGKILATGSAPSAFGDLPLSALSDVTVSGDEPILLENLEVGDTYELDGVYQAAIANAYIDDIPDDPTATAFFSRGPNSEDENTVSALAVNDEDFNQKTIFILFPYASLPDDIEPILLENILNWFQN
ncbi:MAG: hypothetical protein CSB13_04335 [Chloroflexi bacterium]|nr:MAG: hypothetical protein CSB13_04335 [Chloroflexota bacterium]